MVNTYTIYLGATPIICTSRTEFAYEMYKKAYEIAELIGKSACLVWDETGEIIEDYEPEEF